MPASIKRRASKQHCPNVLRPNKSRVSAFLVQIKRITCLATQDQAQSLVIIFVQAVLADRLIDIWHFMLIKSRNWHDVPKRELEISGRSLQVVDFDLVDLAHVHVIAGRIDRVWIIGTSEEARCATFANDVALFAMDEAT